MPRVFVCADGGNAFVWTGELAHSGGFEPAFAYPQCEAGFASWVDLADLIGETGGTTGGTTTGATTGGAPPVDPAEAFTAFGAGFGIFGVGLLMAYALRLIVSAVRGS